MLGLALLLAAAATMPFTVVDNRILLNASIDGRPGFRLILDSGTNGMAVTPQTARKLGLPIKTSSTRITGAGARSVVLRQGVLRAVSLDGAQLGRQPAVVVDLDEIRRKLHFPRLDGIVGYDVLRARYLRIDMDRRQLSMSDAPLPVPRSARTAPYELNNGALQVQASINGVASNFIIDTGDRSSLTIFQPFARANGFFGMTPIRSNAITGYGIGGPIRGNLVGVYLQAFGFDLPDVLARIPLGNAGVFSTASQAGSIGNGILTHFNAIYDLTGHSIALWPARDAAVPRAPDADPALPRHATFGAVMADRNGKATVARVLPNSAASAAGILAGDVITQVDRKPTSDTASFLAELHTHHAGENALVTVVRNGAALSRAITFGSPLNESDPLATTLYESVRVDGSLRRVLLTFPKDAAKPLPAMLLLGGIGCYSVDVAALPEDPYMRLAHDAAHAGFITMRVEKSGVGDSEGPPCISVDFAAEERAYAAALNALRSDPRVDPARVYVFGHSIGSLEAPRLALAQRTAGVIAAEAVGRDWPEYEVRNLRRQLELQNTPPADVDAQLLEKQTCMGRLLLEKQPESVIERSDPACKTHNGVYPAAASYMQQVAAINIIGTWSKIAVPALIIYGQSDAVTEAADHERIAAVINTAHAGYATYTPIDGMDHLLYQAATPKAALDAFLNNSPRTYDPELSRVVIDWLKSVSRP